MIQPKLTSSLFLGLFVTMGCQQPTKLEEATKNDTVVASMTTSVLPVKDSTNLPASPDLGKTEPEALAQESEPFDEFIKKFNTDFTFQISRVQFPLQVKQADPDQYGKLVSFKIKRNKYTKVDFTYSEEALTQKLNAYRQGLKLNKDRATIEIRGIENGIYADYFFQRIKGEWFFTGFTDKSN